MFCAVPCPVRRWEPRLRVRMLLCFPLLGLLLGGLWGLLGLLLRRVGGGTVSAAALAVCPYLLTGFIHLDGFMDCCDAILSRRDRDERRRILKDSHVGSFAVICIGILLLLGYAVQTELAAREDAPLLLFAGISCAARCPSAFAVLRLPLLPTSGYAADFRPEKAGFFALAELALVAAAAVVLCGRAGFCTLFAALGASLAIRWGFRDLGGMSGDISGLGVTVGELCGAAALAFL